MNPATNVWVVRRNDPLDHEIDVFAGDDYETAARFAAAADGTVTEEPILRADDEYVLLVLASLTADEEEAEYMADIAEPPTP